MVKNLKWQERWPEGYLHQRDRRVKDSNSEPQRGYESALYSLNRSTTLPSFTYNFDSHENNLWGGTAPTIVVHKITTNNLHRSVAHVFVIVAGPSALQSFPPLSGAGLVQVRCLIWTPVPQDTGHLVHLDQFVKLPSPGHLA